MIASIIVALLVLLAGALSVAVIGALLAPRPSYDEQQQQTAPWAATRGGNGESLKNIRSPAALPGEARMAAGRIACANDASVKRVMYPAPPSAAGSSIFRRAL